MPSKSPVLPQPQGPVQKVRKSPLATLNPGRPNTDGARVMDGVAPVRARTPKERRANQLAVFEAFLNSTISKRGRPYSVNSIRCFIEAAGSLEQYLAEVDFQGELQDITHIELNAYLAWYRQANGQGGVVTKQGNLRQLFHWITDEYDLDDNPYEHRKRNVYRREDVAPPSLSESFYVDLLDTCRGREFLDLRDAALLRTMMLGPRLGMIEAMQVEDLELRERLMKMRPFKASDNWSYMAMPESLIKFLSRYLRVRMDRGFPADHGDLWVGAKRRTALGKSGIYQALMRRVDEAGYDTGMVHPHLFRHTAAGQAKALGLSDEEIMQHFQWTDPAMVHRYGRSGAQQRSVDAFRAAGFGNYR